MRPQVQTVTGDGVTDAFGFPTRMNYRQNAFKIGIQAVIQSGTPTFGVQFTMDDPADFTDEADYSANADWFQLENTEFPGPSGLVTANTTSNIIIPIQAIRGNVTDAAAGEVKFTFLQGNAW